MNKRSKKYKESAKLVEDRSYALKEGVDLIKKFINVKFDSSVEVHINMNLNPKHASQNLRDTVILPNGSGKKLKIAALVEGDNQKKAEKAGADFFILDEIAEKISKGQIDFDVAITTPSAIKKVAKLAKILGPKGLMPSPKAGTVGEDVTAMISDLKKGKIEYKCDKFGIIHSIVGKVSFEKEKIVENLIELLRSISENKPSDVKGRYFKKISLSTTMGPSIDIILKDALSCLLKK